MVRFNVLNVSGKVKNLHLLKGSISLAEVGWRYGKTELSTSSIQDKEYEIRSSFLISSINVYKSNFVTVM
jgi:hypothetical protein